MLFCVFICIFFFKQKTAYEMRISDWSSDVCSSDLAPPLRERAEDLPLLIDDLIRSQAKAGHGSVRLAPDAINVLRHYNWPGNVRELSNLKIGRASCRERVCPYV